MGIRRAFLNEYIKEKVYVDQPSGFLNLYSPKRVFKLKKASYSLKQVPRA